MAAAVTSMENRQSLVVELTRCAICLDVYRDPRSLPCLHTFCFACLDKVVREIQQLQKPSNAGADGATFSCPLCRESYPLTDGGANEFQRNFFVAALVQIEIANRNGAAAFVSAVADYSSAGPVVADPCSACSVEQNDGQPAVSVPAEVFCRDCSQKLCKRCAIPHRRWAGGPHDVVPLTADVSIELLRRPGLACDSCPGEVVKMFCVDCRKNICLVCVETDHVGHAKKKIAAAAEEIGHQIDDDVRLVTSLRDEIASQRSRMESECDRFRREVDMAQTAIERRGEELKRLIDALTAGDIEKLKSTAGEFEKQEATQRDRFELALTALSGFVSRATELRERGRPHDVTAGGRQVHERAAELMSAYGPDRMRSDDCWAPIVEVTWSEIDEWQRIVNSCAEFVARVNVFNFSREPEVLCAVPDGDPIWGIASIAGRLYVLRSRVTNQIDVYDFPRRCTADDVSRDSSVTALEPVERCRALKPLNIEGLRGLADMAACALTQSLYVVDCVAKRVFRLRFVDGSLTGYNTTTWPVNDEPWGVSVTSNLGHVLIACDEAKKVKEFEGDGQLVREICLQTDIVNPCHAVLMPNAYLSDVGSNFDRFAVCHGAGSDSIHRVCIVDVSGRVLLSYGGPIDSATERQVDSASKDDAAELDAAMRTSSTPGHVLEGPRHLAVSSDGYVFVADYNNCRVLLLSPKLEPIADVVVTQAMARNSGDASVDGTATETYEKWEGLRWNPWRLCFDERGRRLCVAENEWEESRWKCGRMVVYNL